MSNLNKRMFENNIEEKWLDKLWPFLSSNKMIANFKAIKGQKSFNIVYPPYEDCFKAFKLTPWDDIKVVIIGQYPYNDGSADGLAYSASRVVNYPTALVNIILEVEEDCYNGLNIERVCNPNLAGWAKQGVLMLNTAFTVERKKLGNHNVFWNDFTQEVFRLLREEKTGLIYLLWGDHPKSYKKYISEKFNYILESGDPHNLQNKKNTDLFRQCKHFSKTNDIIMQNNGPELCIDWGI